MSSEHNNSRKNLFFSACFCWETTISLREMDQKFKFGGIFGLDESYLEIYFNHFKLIKLHALLHDAAGEVRAHSGKFQASVI